MYYISWVNLSTTAYHIWANGLIDKLQHLQASQTQEGSHSIVNMIVEDHTAQPNISYSYKQV